METRPGNIRRATRHLRWRTALLIFGSVVALFLPIATQASATTQIELTETTFNRPSMVWATGDLWMAWAGTDYAGEINVAQYPADPSASNQVNKWTLGGSGTFTGAGASIGFNHSFNHAVVAWTDGGGDVDVAVIAGSGNDGFGCETTLGASTYTPYVTSEGQDGSGNTYVTFVNTAHQMVVDQLDLSSCSGSSGSGEIGVDNQDVITSDKTDGGPALTVSGYGTSNEQFWMVWTSTGTPTINIAQYTPGVKVFTDKTTETTHTTTADIGAAYNGGDGKVFDTYCGTNNVAYYQYFTPGSGGISGLTQSSVNNDSCGLVTTNGWTSGGVGAAYDYNSDSLSMWQAWDSSACTLNNTNNCQIFLAPIPNP